MLTLPIALERLRRDLGDTDVANPVWTTDGLERHLNRALAEVSRDLPREMKTTLQTTPNSRDVSIATLTGRVRLTAVEYPAAQYPPQYVRWSLWGDTLTLLVEGAPAGVEELTVYWQALHTIDPAGSTLPEDAEDLLVLGATGYALTEAATRSVNAVNTGGPRVPGHYAAHGRAALDGFRAQLRTRGDRGRVRSRNLYVPEGALPSQSTDPGP